MKAADGRSGILDTLRQSDPLAPARLRGSDARLKLIERARLLIALDDDMPVVAIAPRDKVYDKIINNVEQVIQPRLKDGEIVISDRYYDSTIAYQGYGHQQDLEQVRALVKYATGGLTPDLTILLDLDVEIGLGRKKKDNEWNRLDAYTVEFHKRVRAGYLDMVKAEPSRWVTVNAELKWDAVQEELRKMIVEKLNRYSRI